MAEEARRASYVGALPGGQFDYAVFVVSNATKRLADATSAIVEELSVQNKKATGSLFSEAFACEQGFEAFFEGRGSADITAMSLATVASHLLLVHAGTPTSEPLKGDFDGAYTYTMPLTAVIIDASNGTRVGELVVSEVSGAGMMSEAAARSAFLERAAQVLVARLTALQARAGTE